MTGPLSAKVKPEEFLKFTQQLSPRIGAKGGRYFGNSHQSYRLNDIVRAFKRMADENPGNGRVMAKINKEIRKLDDAGKAELAKKGLMIRLRTKIRSLLGNLFYKRNREMEMILRDHPFKVRFAPGV